MAYFKQLPSSRQTMSNLKLFTVLPSTSSHRHYLGYILLFYSTVFLSSAFLSPVMATINSCELKTEEWVEKTIEERTTLADIVAYGRVVRQHHPENRNKTNFLYAADIKILEIYKGYRHFEDVSTIGDRAEHVYRILGFGERKRCYSEAHENQEYILFLTTYSMASVGFDGVVGLTAKYDDFHGAAEKFSNKHEGQVLATLGWKPWSSWSACPVSCGGAVQRRRRLCVKDVADACEGSAEQLRNCNEFGCTGNRNLLQILQLSFFPKGVRRTPLRWQSYRIRSFANLRQPTTTAFPHGFPREFSVIMSVRPKYTRNVDGDLYVFVVTDQDGDIEFGIQLGDVPYIVYSETTDDGRKIQHSEAFTEYSLEREWHTMAFSIRGSTVSLYVDCSTMIKHQLVSPIVVDSRGITAIGSPVAKSTRLFYEGDVEQLLVIGDANAAQLQCVEPQHLIPTLSSQPSATSPWDIQANDESISYRLLIPPPYFKTWSDNITPQVTTKPSELQTSLPTSTAPVKTTTDSGRRWDGQDNGLDVINAGGQDNWFKITLPPHLIPNLIPLARELELKPNPLTPATGTVDIDMRPPPITADPLMPKPPANIIGDQIIFPGDGLPGQLGIGEESTGGGYGELLSGTPGRDSGKQVHVGGRDGGHDVPFDVTIPQQVYWRGDAPDYVYQPATRSPTTTHGTTTTRVTTPEDYADYSSSSNSLSALPSDSESIFPPDLSSAYDESATTKYTPITKEPLITTDYVYYFTTSDKPDTTSESTTSQPEPTTTKPVPTTADVQTTTDYVPSTTEYVPTTTTSYPTTKIPDPPTTIPTTTVTTPAAPTTTLASTTVTTVAGIINNVIDTILGRPTRGTPLEITPTKEPAELSNLLQNDAGVIDIDTEKLPQDSEDKADITFWSSWSTCSKSCDAGIRYRFTFCTKDSKMPDCIMRNGRGVASETKTCNVKDCEAPREVRWSAWSSCSRSCGEGYQTRMALCVGKVTIPECIGRRTAVQRVPCTGTRCVCSPSCQNGGKCLTDGSCDCRSGFTGLQCQNRLQSYSRCKTECANGGICVASGRCACAGGFSGPSCQTVLCAHGCRNGGRCVAPNTCACSAGYGGHDCSQPICQSGCSNGGVCVRPDFCRCPAGYRGSQCQLFKCRRQCRNGGRCVGPDKCSCPSGFRGDVCQMSSCYGGCPAGSRCMSPGRCVNVGNRQGGSGNSYQLSSYSSTNCRLASYTGTIKRSYIKPEVKTIQTRCGPDLSSVCPRTRIQYSRGYRTYYKTLYRMSCKEPT